VEANDFQSCPSKKLVFGSCRADESLQRQIVFTRSELANGIKGCQQRITQDRVRGAEQRSIVRRTAREKNIKILSQ
jgi:hypothetical protein